jgi:hypothetical protein
MSACKNATVASVENLIVSLKATVVEALFQDYPGTWLAVSRLMACARFCRIRKFLLPRSAKSKKIDFYPCKSSIFPRCDRRLNLRATFSPPPPIPPPALEYPNNNRLFRFLRIQCKKKLQQQRLRWRMPCNCDWLYDLIVLCIAMFVWYMLVRLG